LQKVKYARANSVDEAIALLDKGGATARPLAGGTDLIVQARERRRQVELFVDIKPIPETQDLKYDARDGLTIGASLPAYKIYGNENVRRLYPALVDATSVIGGTAIQGRASLGGNLCNSSPAADSVTAMIAPMLIRPWRAPRCMLLGGVLILSFHSLSLWAGPTDSWGLFIPDGNLIDIRSHHRTI